MSRRALCLTGLSAPLVFLLLALAAGSAGALENLSVGQSPPPLSLPAPDGRVFSLDYFAGGPGAIIFWSTWSPRSAEALEDFRRHHEKYGPRGLKILAVNIDGENLTASKKRHVRQYVDEQRLPFPVLLDEKLQAFVAYGVMAHPSTVVISREGRIAYSLGGYPLSLREELEDEIRKALGIFVEPPVTETPAADVYPGGGALQYYRMALNLLDRGQRNRALDALGKARERDPNYFEPVVMSARIHLAAGEVEAAEGLLRSADLTLINRNDLRYLLGTMLLRKGKAEDAEKRFRALQENSPHENWGYWGLAMVYLSRGRCLEALGELKEVPAPGESSPEVDSFIREFLVSRWEKGQPVEMENDFLALFPKLRDVRRRYEIMFSAPAAAD